MGEEKDYHLPRIPRAQILNAYKAGPEAIISLIEYLQAQHDNTIDQVVDQIKKLTQRIKALEEKNDKGSHNSDKPSSSDGLHRRIHKRRESSGKKPGGQEGHEGTTLSMVEHPQQVQIHEVKVCQGCGKSLRQEKVRGFEQRQVFDIPPIAVDVTEHRAQIKRCPHCRELSVAAFPLGVSHKTQYGPRLKRIIIMEMQAHMESDDILADEERAESEHDFGNHGRLR
jgi:transposase